MPKPLLLLDKHDDTVDTGADSDSPAAPRAQLIPDDWVCVATDLFITKSTDAVRVDVLVKQLDVTCGSLYWHLKNRDDLLYQALQDWSERTRVGPKLERQNSSVQGFARGLLALPFRGCNARYTAIVEFATRAWTRCDPMAQEAVEAADEHRMNYYTQYFQVIGFMRKDAKMRVFILYAYQPLEVTFWHQGSKPDKDARRRLFEGTLLTGASQEDSATPSQE